jgi:conjugative transfer region protein TrbK
MTKTKLDKLPMAAAMLLVVFAVAACAFRLRDDENQAPSAASAAEAPDPLARKLAECRSVTYEQKDALPECRKAWAEKRRQLLGQTSPGNSTPQGASPLFVPPDDSSEPRLGPPAHNLTPQSGKE